MSRYITLAEAKEHLIVECDDYDSYIETLIETAESAVLGFLNRDSFEEVEVYGDLPASIRHAIKIQISNLYENREGNRSGRVTTIPFTYSALILPYRKET